MGVRHHGGHMAVSLALRFELADTFRQLSVLAR
jgi:hypothetical protein